MTWIYSRKMKVDNTKERSRVPLWEHNLVSPILRKMARGGYQHILLPLSVAFGVRLYNMRLMHGSAIEDLQRGQESR